MIEPPLDEPQDFLQERPEPSDDWEREEKNADGETEYEARMRRMGL